jgi:hypothetical protein
VVEVQRIAHQPMPSLFWFHVFSWLGGGGLCLVARCPDNGFLYSRVFILITDFGVDWVVVV